jgi:hypothetical protein
MLFLAIWAQRDVVGDLVTTQVTKSPSTSLNASRPPWDPPTLSAVDHGRPIP